MAIIPGKFCEDCDNDGERTPAEHEWDNSYPDSGGWFLCDMHAGRRYDRHQEAKFEEYWGSSQPVTLDEQYQAAAKQKREQR